jgi:hypothetical protein
MTRALSSRNANAVILNSPTGLIDRYLTLDELSAYSGMSVRKLRHHLRDPANPLPCYRPGGKKIVVRQSEFDRWMTAFRCQGDTDIDKIVDDVLRDLN